MIPMPLLQKRRVLRPDPVQRFADFTLGDAAPNLEAIQIDDAVPTIAQLDMNMGRRVVIEVHDDSTVVETLKRAHRSRLVQWLP
jgi:hypothetical protein